MTVTETSANLYWSSKSGYAPNWYSFCADLINSRITGDAKKAPTIWAMQTYFHFPAEHLLEIGCLTGDKIFNWVQAGLALRATGLDVAAIAIERGKEKHGDAISLVVGDLNHPSLPQNTFDVILSNGVLHHIQNLDICCQALYDSLQPGGVLIASEFTGPQRYAYSAKEVQAINHGIEILPEELRGDFFHPDQLEIKLISDPSESIRTRDIGLVLESTFDRVVSRPYGGNVLMRALTPCFFANFDPANTRHTEAMIRLMDLDSQVSSSMPSHHHFYVAMKSSQ